MDVGTRLSAAVAACLVCCGVLAAPAAATSPPDFSTSFGDTSIPTGATTSLAFVVHNPNAVGLTGVGFTDSLPAGLVVANPVSPTDGCNGALTATSGASTISYGGGSLGAGGTCLIGLRVLGTTAGAKDNTTSAITFSAGTGGAASASLRVDDTAAQLVAGFTRESIAPDGTVSLTFNLSNPYAGTTVTGISLTDTLPPELSVATPNGLSGSCAGGSLAAAAGGSTVMLSGASLAPHERCTFSVMVTGRTPGDWTNGTTSLTADDGSGVDGAPAMLNVVAPTQPDDTDVTNGPVWTMARANGRLYLGGQFTMVGPRTGPFGLTSQSGGQLAGAMPAITGGAGRVEAVVSDGAGGFYIGGNFTHVGGVAREDAAHVRADGTVDPGWDPKPNDEVTAIALSGATVYMGGLFTSVDGSVRRDYAAAVSASTGAATGWDPEPDFWVYALALSGSTVYLGGEFTHVNDTVDGSVARQFAAAVDATTAKATAFNPVGPDTQPLNGAVRTIAVSGSTVYLGGDFTYGAGCCLAAVDASTGARIQWAAANRGAVARPAVYALAVAGSSVYVGGDFASVNGLNGGPTSSPNAGAVSATGITTAWNPQPSAPVRALTIDGSTVYLAGDFTGTDAINGSLTRNGLAAVDATTGRANAWDPSASGEADALAVSGTNVAVGGSFSSLGAEIRHNAAALDEADGTLTAWNPDTRGLVRSLAVFGSTVYLGGDFIFVNGTLPRTGLAAVDADTGQAKIWDPEPCVGGGSCDIDTLAIAGSAVYVGGLFDTVNGGTALRHNLAAFDLTVGTATSWAPSTNDEVRVLVPSGSDIFIGGDFTTVDGTARDRAASVNASTGGLTTFNPNISDTVYSISIAGPTAYLGGAFHGAGSVNGSLTRNYAAAADTATGAATAWNPDPSQLVNSASVAGPSVFLGGFFYGPAAINGSQRRNDVAQVDADQGHLTPWYANPTGNGFNRNGTSSCCMVQSVMGDSAGGVLVGGDFTTFDLAAQSGFASFSVPPSDLTAPALTGTPQPGQTLTCAPGTWSGSPAVFFYQWLRDGATVGGAIGPVYGVTAGDAGHELSCEETAKNFAGRASATSRSVTVPPPGGIAGGSGGGAGAGGAPAAKPPVLTHLTIHPGALRAASRGASIARAVITGATVSYTDSEAATTTFTVSRAVRGVRSGRRCLVPSRKPTGRRRRICTRYVVVGPFTHRDVPGRNRFHFTGRIKQRTLRAGHYLLTAVPSAAGAVGTAASVLFRIVG
jgi:hypothetical protein